MQFDLEHKFMALGPSADVDTGLQVEGYASLFEAQDQGGDIVTKGAYAAALKSAQAKGQRIKMLWQHDPSQPIGVWDDIYEDEKGLYVKGRILTDLQKGREAAALIGAGAIDGLSIGFRTIKATQEKSGVRRLRELELWEVSLVTFAMLPEARLTPQPSGQKHARTPQQTTDLAAAITRASAQLGARINPQSKGERPCAPLS